MKKNVLFSVLILAVSVVLFLLKATGMAAHIGVGVVGLALLVVYAVATKKEWKNPALEVLCRVVYAIALITGVVVLKVSGIAALGIVHKASAAIFTVLFIILFVQKVASKAK